MRFTKLLVSLLIALSLLACKDDVQVESDEVPEQSDSETQFNPHKGPIKAVCSAPPPVQDIWKLEPMLTEKGLIKEDMSKQEKEKIIRDYINKKNSAYKNCLKGK